MKTIYLMLDKQCANGHGPMINMVCPALVFVGADAQVYADNLYDFEGAEKEIPWARLIVHICPTCGYYESIDITQDAFEEFCNPGWVFEFKEVPT